MRHWSFAKGHGTGNDFVVLLDREAMMAVGELEVRFLCNRHIGIGGDGLLRAVWARYVPEWDGDHHLWFMDYRNADGSIAGDVRQRPSGSSSGSCCIRIWLPVLSSRWPPEPG